ncbi:MAG: DUF4190 domain-containing protein [Micromonosporaceae bacterium]|nr:DUF4190 domain-containing protein [Micromonosporaceae bacterium]
MTESPTQWPDPYQPPAQSSTPPAAPPTYPAYQTPPSPYGATGYPGAYPVSRPTNGLALTSMILSLVGLVTCLAIPVSTVGAILGHIGLKQIRETGQDGETYAKVGIIVGWIATGLVLLGVLGFVLYIFVIAAAATAS